MVSEDDDEERHDTRRSRIEDYEDVEESRSYEFDVQLKVWRRSRANMWRTPSFD